MRIAEHDDSIIASVRRPVRKDPPGKPDPRGDRKVWARLKDSDKTIVETAVADEEFISLPPEDIPHKDIIWLPYVEQIDTVDPATEKAVDNGALYEIGPPERVFRHVEAVAKDAGELDADKDTLVAGKENDKVAFAAIKEIQHSLQMVLENLEVIRQKLNAEGTLTAGYTKANLATAVTTLNQTWTQFQTWQGGDPVDPGTTPEVKAWMKALL